MIPLYYAYVAFSNLSMVSTVMGLYLEHVGFSLAGVGVLFGALQLGKTLLEVPTGFVADRFGSRASLVAAVALEMAGYSLMLVARGLPAMLCVMLVLASAYTLTTGCATAIVADHLIARGREGELTRVSAVSRIVFYCCYGASALAAGLLADVGYALVFALSIASLAGALACVLLMRYDRAGEKDGAPAAPVRALDAARYVAGCRPVLYYVLVEGAVAWSMVPVDDFYNNYLNGYFGVPLPAVGAVVAAQFAVTSLAGLGSSRLARRLGDARVARLGPLAVVALFLAFAFCAEPRAAVALYMAGLAAFCLVNPVRTKVLNVALDPRYRVTSLSFASIAVSLLSAVSQPLFGWLSGLLDMRLAMVALLATSIALLGAINLAFSHTDLLQKEAHS